MLRASTVSNLCFSIGYTWSICLFIVLGFILIIQNKTIKKWDKQKKAAKATQIAFDLEQKAALYIRKIAACEGLTPSDQIRKMIGLSFSPPKRPRLTMSLTPEDYAILGKKYNIDPENTLAIRRRIMDELIKLIK